MKAFSFDLKGKFAFFKKNDANDVVLTTYNFIHKPAVLGIIGAIIGLKGYAQAEKNMFPEYYEKLRDIKIAIKPHYKYPLRKEIVYFNNATGLASSEQRGIWQVREQILVGEPYVGYTIFVLDDEGNDFVDQLLKFLSEGKSTYLPYFGKNEFFAYYEFDEERNTYNASQIKVVDRADRFIFNSLVRAEDVERMEIDFSNFDPLQLSDADSLTVYENLPIGFDENGFYEKVLIQWGDEEFKIRDSRNFYILENKKAGEKEYVQFF